MSHIGDNIFSLSKVLKSLIESELNKFGIGVGQLQILMILTKNKHQTISQKDLSSILNVDKGNISRSIKKLLDKNYIIISVSNERKQIVNLTDNGEAIMRQITPIFMKINEDMIQDIEAEKLEVFQDVLNKMINNLEDK